MSIFSKYCSVHHDNSQTHNVLCCAVSVLVRTLLIITKNLFSTPTTRSYMTQIRTLNLITTSSLTLMKTLVDSSHTGNNSPYEHTHIQTQTHNYYYSSESSLSQSLSKGVCLTVGIPYLPPTPLHSLPSLTPRSNTISLGPNVFQLHCFHTCHHFKPSKLIISAHFSVFIGFDSVYSQPPVRVSHMAEQNKK